MRTLATEPSTPPVNFRIAGDWGNANFHVIAGLLTAHLRWASAPRSEFWIKTATGFRDSLKALTSGEVDAIVTTPADLTARWARQGIHFFAPAGAAPQVCAIAALPHNDRIVFALHADLGISSFAELRAKKPCLNVASVSHSPDNLLAWVIDRILELHGVDVAGWGGRWIEHDHPRICLPTLLDGTANAVINEGIMVPQWKRVVDSVPLNFLPFEPQALEVMRSHYGLVPGVLPDGYLNQKGDVPCVDFSNFSVLVREDMDDALAYRLTSILVEQRTELEGRFTHLPSDRSPLAYPVDPTKMCQGLGAPLHPGAERYFREHGHLGDRWSPGATARSPRTRASAAGIR